MSPSGDMGQADPAAVTPPRASRRRQPNQREQFKRQQWGKSWGRIMSGIGRELRQKRG